MKLERRDVLTLIATSTATLVLPRWARASDDACSPAALTLAFARIAKARAKVTTLTGPFTQERSIGLLAATVRSTGTMTLVRPDRLRWELNAPDSVVYWVTPEGLAYKGPAGQGRVPAASQRVAAALDDLRVLLGGDLATLEARYDVTGTCREGTPLTFRAVPKGATTSSFREILFGLASDLVSPESVTIVEGPRDRTLLHFGAMHVNAAVPPGLMTPPSS